VVCEVGGGQEEDEDVVEKGKMDSSNMTWREM